jgi:hypothetical protein
MHLFFARSFSALFDSFHVPDDQISCALSFDLFGFMNTRCMSLTTNLSRVLMQSDLFCNLLCLTFVKHKCRVIMVVEN